MPAKIVVVLGDCRHRNLQRGFGVKSWRSGLRARAAAHLIGPRRLPSVGWPQRAGVKRAPTEADAVCCGINGSAASPKKQEPSASGVFREKQELPPCEVVKKPLCFDARSRGPRGLRASLSAARLYVRSCLRFLIHSAQSFQSSLLP